MPQMNTELSLDSCFDSLNTQIQHMGFEAVIYDFAPVPLSLEGELITPSLLRMQQAPEDMQTLWSEHGYYQIDPVQRFALNRCAPFVWSYRNPERTLLRSILNETRSPVGDYLNDNDMASGITVPLHLPEGGFATLTAMMRGIDKENDLTGQLAQFGLLAMQFQEQIYPFFDGKTRRCSLIELTPRERECLSYAAQGLTAKEIAAQIYRSVATVTLHLNTAVHKLGATNRVEAVVRAMHYRLLD